MSNSDRDKVNPEHARIAAETTMGVVNELGVRGGAEMLSYVPKKEIGKTLVKGAAWIAPGAVAVASTGTAATVTATATAAATAVGTAVATVAAPLVIVGASGFAVYKLVKWIQE